MRLERQNSRRNEDNPELTPAMKGNITRRTLKDLLGNLILAIIIAAYLHKDYHSVSECKAPIGKWLAVFCAVLFLSVIQKIIYIITVHCKSNVKWSKCSVAINCMYVTLYLGFEIGWLIYGNTFFYKAETT